MRQVKGGQREDTPYAAYGGANTAPSEATFKVTEACHGPSGAADIPPETVALVRTGLAQLQFSQLSLADEPAVIKDATMELLTAPAPPVWCAQLHTGTSSLQALLNDPARGPTSANGLRRQVAKHMSQSFRLRAPHAEEEARPSAHDPQAMVALYERAMQSSALSIAYTRALEGPPIHSPLQLAAWWHGHQLHCTNGCAARGRWEQARATNHENPCYVATILAWIHYGYLPPFQRLPEPFTNANRPSTTRGPELLRAEMADMEAEGVVSRVPHGQYQSPLGLVVKGSALDDLALHLHELHDHGADHLLDGHDVDALNAYIARHHAGRVDKLKVRVVWDLSTHVNRCFADLPFSHPDADDVLATVAEGGQQPYLYTWDIRRCFHAIPLHPLARPYITCELDGQLLQAQRAIFGASPRRLHPHRRTTANSAGRYGPTGARRAAHPHSRPPTAHHGLRR